MSGRLGSTHTGTHPDGIWEGSLVDLDVDVVAARAVIEVLNAWYDERDTLAQRPQDALRRMRTDHAEDGQDAGQRQAGAVRSERDAHLHRPAAQVRRNGGPEHLAAPVRLILKEARRRPGPRGQDVSAAVAVGELALSLDGLRIDRELAFAGDCDLVAVRRDAKVGFFHHELVGVRRAVRRCDARRE